MEKKNGFLYAKAAVAALCGAFTRGVRLVGLAGAGLGGVHGAGLA